MKFDEAVNGSCDETLNGTHRCVCFYRLVGEFLGNILEYTLETVRNVISRVPCPMSHE